MHRFDVTDSVLSVCVTTAFLMLGSNLVSPVLPLYGQAFGVGVTVVGLLISAFGLARILVDIPGGRLADRVGTRATMLAGTLLVALASAGAAVAPDFPFLVACRALEGVGSALYMVAGFSFIAAVSPPGSRGRLLSYYQGSILIGQSFGPTAGGFTAERYGLTAPFWLYGALALLSAALTLRAVPPRPKPPAPPETAGRQARGIPEPDLASADPGGHGTAASGLGTAAQLLRNPAFVLVCLVTFAVAYTRTGARGTIVPLLGANVLGLSEGRIGLALTVAAVLNLGLMLVTGRIVDSFGRKIAIVPGLLVSAASMVLFIQARDFAHYVLAAAVLGLGTGVAGPAPAAYVSDILPRESFGSSVGLYRAIMDAGMVAGPVVAGAVADLTGLPWALVLNAALLAGAALLFAWRAPETRGAARGAGEVEAARQRV